MIVLFYECVNDKIYLNERSFKKGNIFIENETSEQIWIAPRSNLKLCKQNPEKKVPSKSINPKFKFSTGNEN